MMLYWGMFTVGFIVGVSLALVIFRQIIFSEAALKLEENFETISLLEEVPQLH